MLVELRVDLQLFQSRDDERIDGAFRKALRRGLPDGIFREIPVGTGQRDGTCTVGTVDGHGVGQFAFLAHKPLDGRPKVVDVMLLKVLVEKLRGHLKREHIVGKRNGHDGLKPCLIPLRRDIVLYHGEAPVPYLHMVVAHRKCFNLLSFNLFFEPPKTSFSGLF